MTAVLQLSSQKTPFKQGTRTVRDIWRNGYAWRGQFYSYVDNRIVLRRVIDQVVQVSATMAEKQTAAADLVRYYEHVSGQTVKTAQLERLNDWVRGDYDIADYPVYTEKQLDRMSFEFEKQTDDYGLNMAGQASDGSLIHGRVTSSEPFDIDAEFERKNIKVRY
ncbi:hypothetical protein [Cohnella mopanensis]|uniref:hypothetical protein n=1 Tax=Cohnella mopanensis TaxID=2911966 RepID=UPI001EF91B4C|nr:hypothetical protein [Cohnella mopanensis]